MYFSFRRILLMVLVCHFVLPAPVRMPSRSRPAAILSMLYENCNTLVFIDCMCNCGVYFDDDGNLIDGTSVRVANALLNVARKYPCKMVQLYLNDINKEKVEELRKHIPANERNFQIITTDLDAGVLLRTIGPQLYNAGHLHYFLLYDPYDATIARPPFRFCDANYTTQTVMMPLYLYAESECSAKIQEAVFSLRRCCLAFLCSLRMNFTLFRLK